MSGISYRPPSENLAIFDPSVFLAQQDASLSANNFLQFPNGQGTETIPALIVPGTSTLGVTNATTMNLSDTLNIANGVNTSTLDMNASNDLTITNNVIGGQIITTGDNIQLNATTTGGLTSSTTQPTSTDSSTKIPTTAWVQSAIVLASPMPYYQANYLINQPANFDRYGIFQFNFIGTNWGINDFFSFNLRCSLTTTTIGSPTGLAPAYTTITCKMDVYPNRCPSNIGNPSAYGLNPTQPNTTNFSLTNGTIYIGGGSQSGYVLSTGIAPYAPFGRWYFPTLYSITSGGSPSYPATSPAPFAPYILPGTADRSAFGFGLWGNSLIQTNFAVEVDIINPGPGGVGQGITLTSNYTLGGGTGNTLKETKVGL